MVWHESQSIVTCIVLCAPTPPRVLIFFQSANKNLVLLFGFPPVVFLISNRFQCVISNERKQISDNIFDLLFLSRGYTFWVMIEWIYCTVTFFAHCIVLVRWTNCCIQYCAITNMPYNYGRNAWLTTCNIRCDKQMQYNYMIYSARGKG